LASREACHDEQLSLEFSTIELCKNLPIELRVRIAERAEDPAWHAFEEQWRGFRHAELSAPVIEVRRLPK
jgi:hypothetical protein